MRSEVNIQEEDPGVDELHESFGHMKPPCTLGPMDKFANQISPDPLSLGKNKKQQNISDALFKQRTEAANEYISRWVYEAGISFNCMELDSFKLAIEAVGQFGPGLVTPTRYGYTVPYLRKEVDRTKGLISKHEEEWRLNGCSVMTDAWSDRKRRSIMNVCVNSSLGTVFLSSKDFSNTSHTSEVIFQYVNQCIEEIGPENVVQIVTDNASNNMGAARKLKVQRPKIFWTSCAAHTIDLMLESIAKQSIFKKYIDEAKALTVFLYAHHKVLSMMRFYTKQRDIVRPEVTRFASAFLTLQSIHEKRVELKAMFGSIEWESCTFATSVKGKVAYETVMSQYFWNGVGTCLQIFEPLIKVLRLADGDRKPSMGFIYGEILQAKEDIKIAQRNYEPILEVIDSRMKNRLDSPLHLTAYALNPFYHYKDPLLYLDQKVSLAVLECIDILFPGDVDLQDTYLSVELPKYQKKESIFGKAIAAKACSVNNDNFNLVNWWSTFGGITPNLQRLAMRILSLTSSSSGCERNWSAFEGVHTKRRNRLSTQLLNNLVYVQFNSKLLNKQKKVIDKSCEDVLVSEDSIRAQAWLRRGINDDKDVGDEEQIRELYDEDFESEPDDEPIKENENQNELSGELIRENDNQIVLSAGDPMLE